MKYNYACCCGDEIGKKARWFPKVHWCKTCKALHIYRRTHEGLYQITVLQKTGILP